METLLYLPLLWFWITLPQFASSVSVRLSGGNSFEGRVEVLYKGVWGTICNNHWDMIDANVVCRMLGFPRALATKRFGQGTGQIWLDRVTCFGSESSIDQCCHKSWGNHSCSHYQDAGVVCQPNGSSSNISVRLVNGSVSNIGRVEVRYYGVWKAICDYSWYLQSGRVVCRMLGYSQGAAAVIKRYQGSGNVWLSYIWCNGYETSINRCHLYWGQASCADNRLAGVLCISGTPNITFQLTNRIISNEGQLQVRYYGIWGTVCTYFDLQDAHVVCRMMGYREAAMIYKQAHNGSMYRFGLVMHCNGKENSIEQCGYYISGINECGNWDVWVVCKSAVHESNVTVRLVDGGTPNHGRVEVGHHGVWGTICNNGWGIRDAKVVCRMLNYSKASWAGIATVKGSGPILVYGYCNGNEKSLEFCNNYHWSWRYCSHHSDLAVTCQNLNKAELAVTVRLKGEEKYAGQVEVNYNGTWRPVCGDNWDISDAHVICRMLGYKAALAPLRQYSSRRPNIWMTGVQCSGEEALISECYHGGWTNYRSWCTGYRAGVVCKVIEDPPPVQVRLEDGSSPNSGRVAVRYGDIWGGICTWGLDINDATVICRMLGYPGASKVIPLYTYRRENKTMWLNYLYCNGTEKSIADCRHSGWGKTSCYYHDNNVICKTADALQFNINGTNAITDSTVEILFNDSHPLQTQLKGLLFSAYQVVVKSMDIEQKFKSHGQPKAFTIEEVDYTKAMKLGYDSYVAAEILGPNFIPKLTIGDGQFYHGYYNVPLKAGRNYRVYIRAVTKAADGKRVYGDSAFVAFATKPKDDAPQFQINGDSAIKYSTVEILFNNSQHSPRISNYQVAVEKTENQHTFKSYDQTVPFVFREINFTMAKEMGNDSYITAEILGPISSLTIGDGQYYHGYYNAPLEPGSSYKIHVRTIINKVNGERIYGHSSCVAFTTKPRFPPQKGKSVGNDSTNTVTGLIVFIIVLVFLVIGGLVWYLLRKRRAPQKSATTEMSEVLTEPTSGNALTESLYQSLNFSSAEQRKGGFENPTYNLSIKRNNKEKKPATPTEAAGNEDPESTRYQTLSFPRGLNNDGYDNQEQAYHVFPFSFQVASYTDNAHKQMTKIMHSQKYGTDMRSRVRCLSKIWRQQA